MGEKFIALAAGSPDAPELANGSIIQGEAMVTFDQVAKSAVDVTENLNAVLARLTVDYGQLVSEIHDVIGQGGAVLGDGRQLLSRLDSTAEKLDHIVARIKDDYPGWAAQLDAVLKDGGALVRDSRATMGKVNAVIESADHLITSSGPKISELLSQLQVVAQNLKVVSTYGKALTANLGEKPSRLIWGGRNKFALPSEKEILTREDPVSIERRK
jgi:ABC-type transporter Mla subunit MlaD